VPERPRPRGGPSRRRTAPTCTAAAIALTFLLLLWLAAGAATARAATVRASITWTTDADIDLHVYDQAGDIAWYSEPDGIPTGQLSADVIPGTGDTSQHEEHYTDNADSTPLGVCAVYYDSPGDSPTTAVTYTLTEPGGGATRTGTVTLGQPGNAIWVGATPANTVQNPGCNPTPPATPCAPSTLIAPDSPATHFLYAFKGFAPVEGVPVTINPQAGLYSLVVCTRNVHVGSVGAPPIVGVDAVKDPEGTSVEAEFSVPTMSWDGTGPPPSFDVGKAVKLQIDPDLTIDFDSTGAIGIPIMEVVGPALPLNVFAIYDPHALNFAATPKLHLEADFRPRDIRNFYDKFRALDSKVALRITTTAVAQALLVGANATTLGIPGVPRVTGDITPFLRDYAPYVLSALNAKLAAVASFSSAVHAVEGHGPDSGTIFKLVVLTAAIGVVILQPELAPGIAFAAHVHNTHGTAGAAATTRAGVRTLKANAVRKLKVTGLGRARYPRTLVRRLGESVMSVQVPAAARPLIVNRAARAHLTPRSRVTAVAADLPKRKHNVLAILQGPDHRAERLLQVRRGVAAAKLTMPAHMTRGTWTITVEDLSNLNGTANGKLHGRAQLRMGVFTVARAHKPPPQQSAPEITTVSRISQAQTQTFTISGHRFGAQPAFNGDLPCLAIHDDSKGWQAGHIDPAPATRTAGGSCATPPGPVAGQQPDATGDCITANVTSWTDTQIAVGGFGGWCYGLGAPYNYFLSDGDAITVSVWNAQNSKGPAIYHTTVTG
jgi:hypothetical protein